MSIKEKERKPAPRSGSRSGAAQKSRRSPDTVAKSTAAPTRRSRSQKPRENVKTAPDVVYLPPKPFSRNRLILRLATVVAVVIALTLGLSVFFKVDETKISVSGNVKYTAWDIFQASGIQDGDNLLTFSRTRAVAKIIEALPYVNQVRIGIKLPDTVNIDIVEVKVPYAVKAQDDSWWLISASGKIIEKAADGAQTGYTRILGVQIDSPQAGSQAAALENTQTQTDADGNTIPVTVTQAQRLNTALNIVEYLELNGIIGEATTVDVNDLSDIQVMYGQQYQVKFGTDSQLSYKVSCMKYVIDKLDNYQSGVLDISFTTWKDKVGYTPFDGDSSSALEIL